MENIVSNWVEQLRELQTILSIGSNFTPQELAWFAAKAQMLNDCINDVTKIIEKESNLKVSIHEQPKIKKALTNVETLRGVF